jgi:NAD(P)-dependent dehydrogenase (short-subunit alcohol dehydrogenase family)
MHPTPHRTSSGGALRCLALTALLFLSGCGGEAPAGHPDPASAPGGEDRPVALVTGSTDGLGRELALRLGADGYHVIVHGRSAERGAEVVAAIEAEGTGSATFIAADFASLAEVRALADAVREEISRLDLLVNNAGVGPGVPGHERVVTGDGHELRFQVNYLAHYLLTRELLPLLEAGAPSRIVAVTSRNQQPLDFDDLAFQRGYQGGAAYGRSKLAQVLHVMDLAEALSARGITAYAVHPAPAMDTGLVRETGSTPQTTVEDGLRSVLQAVRTRDHPSGTYFFELEPRPAHEQAYDEGARRLLRERSDAFVSAFRSGS